MNIKKAPEADLENERTTFFLLGFTVVLALAFVCLEWSSEEKLPTAWETFAPPVIEKEYNESPLELPVATAAETKAEPVIAEQPKVVYEDYNIVEEANEPEQETLDLATEALKTPADERTEIPSVAEAIDESVFTEAEIMPQYPGGAQELNRYLFNHLKYPPSAYSQGIEGRVWCSFIINKNGSASDFRIEQGVYISLNQEAMRVLQAMPAWTPGTVRGEPVRVKIYLPIVFKLK